MGKVFCQIHDSGMREAVGVNVSLADVDLKVAKHCGRSITFSENFEATFDGFLGQVLFECDTTFAFDHALIN